MAYRTPPVGTILPAKQNTSVENPGPVHDPHALDEFTQADQQDKAYEKNLVLLEEWNNAKKDSPEYAAQLGAKPSWAVEVISAEAGGVGFDHQRKGVPVERLEYVDPHAQ